MTSPLAHAVTIPRKRAALSSETLASMQALESDRIVAKALRISALLDESFEMTRLYVQTRDEVFFTKCMSISRELSSLGINLD